MKKIILYIFMFLLIKNLNAQNSLLKDKKINVIKKKIHVKNNKHQKQYLIKENKNILNSNKKKEIQYVNSGMYLGNKIGLSKFLHLQLIGQELKIKKGNINSNSLYNSFIIGYKINRFFDLELGYDFLGKSIITGDFYSAILQTRGTNISGKINMPFFYNFNIYTKIGVNYLNTTFSKENKVNKNFDKFNFKNISPLWSVGGEYFINKNFSLRLDYQWIYNIGNIKDVVKNSNNKSLGIFFVYKINSKKNTSEIIESKCFKKKVSNIRINSLNIHSNYKNKSNRILKISTLKIHKFIE